MKLENLFWGVFVIFGIFFAFMGTKIQEDNVKFLETAKSTSAKITDIDAHHTSNNTEYIVYVEFTVDEQIYSGNLNGEWNTTMSVGKDVTIFYDPTDPNNFRGPSTNFVGYIFMGFGAVAALAGAIPIIRSFKREI